MTFTPTALSGVWIVDQQRHSDDRGYFARTWCTQELAAQGLVSSLVQCSTSFNAKRGTLRGMHYQAAPHGETKLVRCTRGAIYDVAIDLRPDSATLHQWIAVELTAANGRALYLPHGIAHGFQTLEDNTEVFYSMAEVFVPDAARGVRWNDPTFAIDWPLPESPILSPRDAALPLLRDLA